MKGGSKTRDFVSESSGVFGLFSDLVLEQFAHHGSARCYELIPSNQDQEVCWTDLHSWMNWLVVVAFRFLASTSLEECFEIGIGFI